MFCVIITEMFAFWSYFVQCFIIVRIVKRKYGKYPKFLDFCDRGSTFAAYSHIDNYSWKNGDKI